MRNGINVRQNEEKSISMLAAQRQLYKDAKKYNEASVVLSIWIPLGLAVALIFLHNNTQWAFVSYVLSIASMFFSMMADNYINKKKELAAFIQQKFDTYIYRMPWDSRLFGKDKNISREVAQYSKRILDNEDEKMKLKNWYTSAAEENSLEDGILACQRENFSWDVGLRKRFKAASIIVIALLCITIFAIGIWRNETVFRLVCRFALVAPMFEWLMGTVRQINSDIINLDELDNHINSPEVKTMQDLQDIQKEIFNHRKQCFIIPDFFYTIFRNNDEEREHRIAGLH